MMKKLQDISCIVELKKGWAHKAICQIYKHCYLKLNVLNVLVLY